MKVVGPPGEQRARRAAEWGKTKYAGSVAEDLWRRLDAMDFINQGMLFAATLLLCFFPFLIVASALAGRSVVTTLARDTGLDSQAAAAVGHLFAPSAATASAVVGTASMVFFVLGGIAAATALQEIYELAFDLPHRGMKDIPRRLAWLAVLIGASLLGVLGALLAIPIAATVQIVVKEYWQYRHTPLLPDDGPPPQVQPEGGPA